MSPFKHKRIVAYYRLEAFYDGQWLFLGAFTWSDAVHIQEIVPRVSIRFSHRLEVQS